MSDVLVRASTRRAFNKPASAAGRLIADSFAAQARLTRGGVIPAMAESPIPVLDSRHRTPDPRRTPVLAHEDGFAAYRFAAE